MADTSMEQSTIMSSTSVDIQAKNDIEEKGFCYHHSEEKLVYYCPVCDEINQLRCNDCMLECNEANHKGLMKIPKAVSFIEETLDALAKDYIAYYEKLKVLKEKLDAKVQEYQTVHEANKDKIQKAFRTYQTKFKEKMEEIIKQARERDDEYIRQLDAMTEVVEEELNRLIDLVLSFTNLYKKVVRDNEKAFKDKELQDLIEKFQKVVRESKVEEIQIQLEEYVPDETELIENIEYLVKVEEKDDVDVLEFKF